MGISRPADFGTEAPPPSAAAAAGADDEVDGQDAEVDENEIPDIEGRSDDDDWADDMSPEAVAARERELAATLKNSMILGDQDGNEDGEDEDEDSPYFQLKVWVQAEKGQADAKAVLAKVKELGIEKKHKAVLVLSEWLYTENAVKEVPQYSKLFATVRHLLLRLLSHFRRSGANHTIRNVSSVSCDSLSARHLGEAPEGSARWH